MKSSLAIALLLGLFLVAACGEGTQAAGGSVGAAATAGAAGTAGVGGVEGPSGTGGIAGSQGSGGSGGSGDTGGTAGAPYQVCTLGLCMDDPEVGRSCQEVYDACVGRGHYPRSCRMDADKTCGVFGETGPY